MQSTLYALFLVLNVCIWLGFSVSECDDVKHEAHTQGVCDMACHQHARVLEGGSRKQRDVKCLCEGPIDRVVRVRGQ